jgi:2-dehydropantoate 2-reductase
MPLPCTIAVIGAGCIGSAVAISIARKESPVRFIGRSSSSAFAALSSKTELTLQINSSKNIISVGLDEVEFTTDPGTGLKGIDLILVATKRLPAITKEVAETVSKYADEQAVVVLLQNGMDASKQLREGFIVERPDLIVLNAVVTFNVVDQAPGQFFLSTPFEKCNLTLEGNGSLFEKANEVARRLGKFFDCYADRDLVGVQAGKLMINLINGPNALAGCDTYTLMMESGYRRVWKASIDEALKVFHKAGITPRTPHDKENGTIRKLPLILSLPTPLVKLILWLTNNTPEKGGKASLAQDMDKNVKETEIDVITGKICSMGRELGIPTPASDKIVDLIKQACQEGKGSPHYSSEELEKKILGS